MFVARLPAEDINSGPKRAKVEIRLALSFSDEDKVGTIQLHDNALVVTLRIGGYDIKKGVGGSRQRCKDHVSRFI